MTEQCDSYHVTRCSVCLTPLQIVSHSAGNVSTRPLTWSERKYDEFVAALKSERETTIRLAARVDALVIERKELAIVAQKALTNVSQLARERDRLWRDAEISLTYYRQMAKERDSARTWAARWKAAAKLEHGASHSPLTMMR